MSKYSLVENSMTSGFLSFSVTCIPCFTAATLILPQISLKAKAMSGLALVGSNSILYSRPSTSKSIGDGYLAAVTAYRGAWGSCGNRRP